LDAEKLAYWFFRLNGCFTFENFIVHPDRRGPQETDADLIALRFQHRSELHTSENPMVDLPAFCECPTLMNVFLVEAKTVACALNGPWKNPDRRNLQRVLYAMGFLPHEKIGEAAKELYEHLTYADELVTIRFVAIGKSRVDHGTVSKAWQMTWEDILRWIHGRFNEFRDQKADHQQWDDSAKKLYDDAVAVSEAEFLRHWLDRIGVVENRS